MKPGNDFFQTRPALITKENLEFINSRWWPIPKRPDQKTKAIREILGRFQVGGIETIAEASRFIGVLQESLHRALQIQDKGITVGMSVKLYDRSEDTGIVRSVTTNFYLVVELTPSARRATFNPRNCTALL